MFHKPRRHRLVRGEDKKRSPKITLRNGTLQGATSSSRRARSASTAARCPGFDNAMWTRRFFPRQVGIELPHATWLRRPAKLFRATPARRFEEQCRIV